MSADLWSEVVGQAGPVAQLQAAVSTPVHAYLLAGPEGSGTREAARAFAADLLLTASGATGDDADFLRTQVGAETHVALHVVEREGATISADQAREEVNLAATTPPAGGLRVILVVDAHLLGGVAPMLLKSIEEPPPSTVFVLTAEELPRDLATIESRCVRIDFAAVPAAVLADRLVAEGVDPAAAQVAAAAAGGSLDRARLLASDPHVAARRDAWYRAAEQLDGTGATAMTLVDELMGGIDEVLAPLAERQAAELAAFEAQVTATGAKVRKGDLKAMEARHAREQRRLRTDELRSGLATLVARYRDAVAAGGSTESFVEVAGRVQSLCSGLSHNPREQLAVQALFVTLPRLDALAVAS
ncbi:MAG: hypothetical protein ACKO04_06350 [Actinomycetes bacterium]